MDESEEYSRKNALNDARRKNSVSSDIKAAKNIVKTATPMGALSLLKYVNFLGDMPYAAALFVALLKDLLTLVFGTELPMLAVVFSICCSIFIGMMMYLAGAGKKRTAAQKGLKKILALIGGGIAGMVPVVDLFFVETLTVGFIYVWTLMERSSAAE